jgi:hypothetical protein
MSEPKWTPGPWRKKTNGNIGNSIEAQSGRQAHADDDGMRIVATYQECTASDQYAAQEENRAANGNLIAAAPELYEALEECASHAGGDIGDIDWAMVRATLVKARGEP